MLEIFIISLSFFHIFQSSDQLVGLSMLLVATSIFIYYTIWTFITPFLDDSNIINYFFLPRKFAIIIPVLLLIIGVSIIGTFIGSVLIKSSKKEKNKKKWLASSNQRLCHQQQQEEIDQFEGNSNSQIQYESTMT